MKVAIVPVTPFEQNCSILVCERTKRAAIVDPGGDLDRIEAALAKFGATAEKIFLTHGHIDHCGGTAELAARLGIPVEGPQREDAFWIDQLPEQGRRFGFPQLAAFTPDRWLEGGDTVQFGEQTLEVRYCPGHTPGHVVFFHRALRVAFVGDVLFRGSIGRTDFPAAISTRSSSRSRRSSGPRRRRDVRTRARSDVDVRRGAREQPVRRRRGAGAVRDPDA